MPPNQREVVDNGGHPDEDWSRRRTFVSTTAEGLQDALVPGASSRGVQQLAEGDHGQRQAHEVYRGGVPCSCGLEGWDACASQRGTWPRTGPEAVGPFSRRCAVRSCY